MQKVGDLPASRGRAPAAHVVGVNVRIDHRRGRGAQLGQQRVVALDVPSRIHHDGVSVTDQDIAERSLADAIELHDVGEGRGG